MSDAAAGTKKIAIKTRKVKRDEKKYKPTRFNSATETNKQLEKKKKRGAISSHLDETGSFNNFTFS